MVGASPPISALYKDEPTIEFLNLLKVDIGTLGNHEFDKGVQEMNRLLYGDPKNSYDGTTTTYISANVIDKQTNTPLFPPYLIKEINGVKIGFIGVLTTETNDYVVYKNREQVQIIDEVSAINQASEQLINKGVKAIVVLAHVSAKSDITGGNPEQALVEMAPLIHDEVDVIFAGHSHSYANTLVDNILIVQGYSYGKAISQVQLQLDSQSGEIVSKDANIYLTLHNFINPDKETMKLLNKYETMLSEKMNEVIVTLPTPISRKKNKEGNSPLAKIVATSMMMEMETDMAFTHHGGIRLSLNKGDLTTEDIYRSLPFDHKVVKISLTGSQIKKVLEQQWQMDKENLLQPAGVSYSIDHDAQYEGKIHDLIDKDGQKLEPTKVYTVAISNYLALGGDGFSTFKAGKINSTGSYIRDVFLKYIKSQKSDGMPLVQQ
jgi:5'-nucleotidase